LNFIDVLKVQLLETENILEVAINNNWVMQIETNEIVKENLERIIAQLETQDDSE
jgi:hypothetical protein